MPNSPISENLKTTIQQAERYTLVALSTAVVFVALSLPNPKVGDVLKWELLGVPLSVAPPLALVVLYFVYVGSCLLADNMLFHVRDLSDKFEDKEEVRAILSYPTILTVSPIGRLFETVLPAALVIFGLIKAHSQGVYQLHFVAWWLAYGFALSGVLVYCRVKMFVVPNLYPERRNRDDTTA
jgi:hypothetical protein